MCIDIWTRSPCGHSIYQNTYHCDHSESEAGDGTVFSDDVVDRPTLNYEDELYHYKPSATELRRRRLSSLSLLSGSPPSGVSVKSPCRVTRAIRPINEGECAECARSWQEAQWHHQQAMAGRHMQRRDYFDDHGHVVGHDTLERSGEDRLGGVSATSSPGLSRSWYGPGSPGFQRRQGRIPSASATRRLENAFFMIAQRQAD
ncbi:uncharacterized protein B0I36DRAFT_334028 [Microdochium trichocladiopsis]|uniref:Uncharacterized protein n=1 Tax=Microdochium trichocladiopsis TaxID=1682393 RepID=A0A9P8XVE2_9PEZI|nr:uncharacterized protein B0I36DRAFT_334028 [Microdochium trichocladiopsis]KAH7021211.1 hypothetical protein B0I36DRAFT_334028 [Microdochium trichocladiopsis]